MDSKLDEKYNGSKHIQIFVISKYINNLLNLPNVICLGTLSTNMLSLLQIVKIIVLVKKKLRKWLSISSLQITKGCKILVSTMSSQILTSAGF